jgi:hypothetical protein
MHCGSAVSRLPTSGSEEVLKKTRSGIRAADAAPSVLAVDPRSQVRATVLALAQAADDVEVADLTAHADEDAFLRGLAAICRENQRTVIGAQQTSWTTSDGVDEAHELARRSLSSCQDIGSHECNGDNGIARLLAGP